VLGLVRFAVGLVGFVGLVAVVELVVLVEVVGLVGFIRLIGVVGRVDFIGLILVSLIKLLQVNRPKRDSEHPGVYSIIESISFHSRAAKERVSNSIRVTSRCWALLARHCTMNHNVCRTAIVFENRKRLKIVAKGTGKLYLSCRE
jgi:hypothetical protein